MKLQKLIRSVSGMAICLCASAALADPARITTFVKRTMVTGDEKVGGCMVFLSQDPADILPACRSFWVTFSCAGTYTDPVLAFRMLDQAQLALASGKMVTVVVDDSKMHDGVCFASRISVLSE